MPIPQVLDYYFRNSSLLFLGCGRNHDRTVRVFEVIKIKARADGADLPQHFSIEHCPGDEVARIERTNTCCASASPLSGSRLAILISSKVSCDWPATSCASGVINGSEDCEMP